MFVLPPEIYSSSSVPGTTPCFPVFSSLCLSVTSPVNFDYMTASLGVYLSQAPLNRPFLHRLPYFTIYISPIICWERDVAYLVCFEVVFWSLSVGAERKFSPQLSFLIVGETLADPSQKE